MHLFVREMKDHKPLCYQNLLKAIESERQGLPAMTLLDLEEARLDTHPVPLNPADDDTKVPSTSIL